MRFFLTVLFTFLVSDLAFADRTHYTCFYDGFKIKIKTEKVFYQDQTGGRVYWWKLMDIEKADPQTKDYYLSHLQALLTEYSYIKNYEAFYVDSNFANPSIFLINKNDPRDSAFFAVTSNDEEFDDKLPCKRQCKKARIP